MRVLSSSLIAFACVATMAATATPASAQPGALAFGEGTGGGVQLVDNRDRRKVYDRRPYRGYGRYYGPYYAPYAYYGPYYSPYYYSYYPPYYGPSVSFSFGF
jgi:hypothetical protein